jgi:topoisomerase IA-like protein
MNTNKTITLDPENINFNDSKKIIDYYIKCKADKLENDKKDKKLNDDITIKTGPYGVYLKLSNNTNVKLPKKYKDNIESLTLEQALEIIEKNKSKPSKGSKASRFGSKASAKPKAKEPKAKAAKEAKPAKAAKEPKEPKAPKDKATKEPKVKETKAKEPKAPKAPKA